ncbi:unnamed protein product [Parascedosporium putredinis]|uniref:Uncharacterized protein n=1 Tax=Parascedosporium putredinis TaxID=1442378 RepID=A0A9P1M9K0_9PEZI|nr:unnamed protein product [Parascedosporium putredinis]CAI7992183.1 unnamed protein product [Parascedosporium putredinis]
MEVATTANFYCSRRQASPSRSAPGPHPGRSRLTYDRALRTPVPYRSHLNDPALRALPTHRIPRQQRHRPRRHAVPRLPHFRIFAAPSPDVADAMIRSLESAYACFVEDLGWRSTGLSFRDAADAGPWTKVNVYNVGTGLGAAANTGTDEGFGMSFINVEAAYLTTPSVTVHEYGHCLTYAAGAWIEQWNTGAWWESVANFVADLWLTSDLHWRLVPGHRRRYPNTGNYYQAWPFLYYIYANPDEFPGLGRATFPGVWTQYEPNSQVTPLHVIQKLAGTTRVQDVVAKYWARMAFLDIAHPKAQALFERDRARLNYQNLDPAGAAGTYRPKAARRPQYMGANIIPLKGTGGGPVSAKITASAPFSATLAIRAADKKTVQYVELVDGAAEATVDAGSEAMLVVVNTPAEILNFDPFKLTDVERQALDYTLTLTGATA